MPLTDTAIKKAKFEDKPYRLTDGGGLYLIVHHRGDLRRTRLPSLPGLGRAESCHSMCWARMAEWGPEAQCLDFSKCALLLAVVTSVPSDCIRRCVVTKRNRTHIKRR